MDGDTGRLQCECSGLGTMPSERCVEWIESYNHRIRHRIWDKRGQRMGSTTLLLIGADHIRYGAITNQMQQNMAMGTESKISWQDNEYSKFFCKNWQKKGREKVLLEKWEQHRSGIYTKRFEWCNLLPLWREGTLWKNRPNKKLNSDDHVHTQVTDEMNEEEDEELGYIYHQNSSGLSWKTCLLIESESSVDIFNNGKYLTKIHKVKKTLNCWMHLCQSKGLLWRHESVVLSKRDRKHFISQDLEMSSSCDLW